MPLTPHARKSLLALVLLGLFLLSLGAAKALIVFHPRPVLVSEEPQSTSSIPPPVTLSLSLPADFEPFDTNAMNLPITPKEALARNDNGAIRRLYIFVIPISDYREAGALEDSSQRLFQLLTSNDPAETFDDKTLAGRHALEYRCPARNGVGFIWQRSVLVFDKLYAVFYTGNTGPGERDDIVFNDIVCGKMQLKPKIK